MANSKISALDQVTSVNGSDVLPIVQGTNSKVTRKVRLDQLPQYAGKIDTTVADLRTMVANSQLKPGTVYAFDFQTKYIVPNTGVEGVSYGEIRTEAPERLIVIAISENKLSPSAYSVYFPEDIIHIDILSAQASKCEDGTTDRDGKITYRKDTKRNLETWYDFRNVRFRRWRSITAAVNPDLVWSSSKNYNLNDIVLDSNQFYLCRRAHNAAQVISINNEIYWTRLMFNSFLDFASERLLFVFGKLINAVGDTLVNYFETFNGSCENISIGRDVNGKYNNIVFKEGSKNITIGEGSSDMTFAGSCYNFEIGHGCKNIRIDTSYSNVIGDNCSDISLNGSNNNIVGPWNSALYLESSLGNSFGTSCSYNVLRGSYNNNFGNSCAGNFMFSSTANTLLNECKWNSFHGSGYNFLHNSCFNNVIGSGANNNTLGNGCANNEFLDAGSGYSSYGAFSSNTLGALCKSNKIRGNRIILDVGCEGNQFRANSEDIYLAPGVKNKDFSAVVLTSFRLEIPTITSMTITSNYSGRTVNLIQPDGQLKYWSISSAGVASLVTFS
ncbi:hypothetical protein [Sporocytophaga myxococcoides]|uniref:hypothetical protein n=1 Tax=Sporocytophaga myxococcoides TaxID=153721 RepID=UPI00048B4D8C|nr:hypothetical protein [Sporocytophaga myxococcoides]